MSLFTDFLLSELLRQHCWSNNYSGILPLTNQGVLNFASQLLETISPLQTRGGDSAPYKYWPLITTTLSLTVDQIAWFLNDWLSLVLTSEAKFKLGKLSSVGVPCHIPPTISPLLAPTNSLFFPHRNGCAIAGCACWPGKAAKPCVIGGPRAPPWSRFFLAPLPKSRLLARLAKLLSRSPVSIFDCDEAEELPAGWRTSPKSAAPGLVTPVDEGWPKTVEKSDTNGVDEVEEGNAEEFDWGKALVGVEEKPSNASNPNLLSFF